MHFCIHLALNWFRTFNKIGQAKLSMWLDGSQKINKINYKKITKNEKKETTWNAESR